MKGQNLYVWNRTMIYPFKCFAFRINTDDRTSLMREKPQDSEDSGSTAGCLIGLE